MQLLYLKPNRRQPIRIGGGLVWADVQGAIPPAWCRGCGKEVFLRGHSYCPACKKEEENDWYEVYESL